MSPATDIISGDIDVLSEILLYIPPKPLIRFKSVSKQWLSLISSPHFCRRHTSRNSNAAVSGILYRRTPGLTSDTDFAYISLNNNDDSSSSSSSSPSSSSLSPSHLKSPTFKGINILQSCSGLLLCSSSSNKRDYYSIYNPTTNQHFTLPRLINETNNNSTILGVTLAFDPRKSPHYKVISLRNTSTDYPFSSSYCRIDVYSSESKKWRECGDPFIAPYHMIFSTGVFSNGAIHWINASTSLLYFDVDQEQLVQTSLLSNHFGKRRFRYFGESCNHLHLLDVADSKTTQFPVFELHEDFSDWGSKYTVDLDQIVVAYPEMVKPYLDDDDFYYAFVILTIVREEGEDGEDESSLLLHIPGKIVSYKFKNGSFKVVLDLTVDHSNSKVAVQYYGCLDAYQYIETLACVC